MCVFFCLYFMNFYPGTMTTHAESINSDLQRGLARHLRHTQHRTQNRTKCFVKELFLAAKFTHLLKLFPEYQTFLNNKLNLLTIGTLYQLTAVHF